MINKVLRIVSCSISCLKKGWATYDSIVTLTRDRLIYMYNLFSHRFDLRYHPDFQGYNCRSKFNIRKTAAKRKLGHWTSINFASNDWNDLNQDKREAGDIATRKRLIKGRGASL